MPTCHAVMLCSGSALDSESNNYTLFNLVEHIQSPLPDVVLQWDQVTFWRFRDEEIGHQFSIRLDLLSDDQVVVSSRTFTVTGESKRHRIRFHGFRVPSGSGEYEIAVRCRRVDVAEEEEWARQPARWPVGVVIPDLPLPGTHAEGSG